MTEGYKQTEIGVLPEDWEVVSLKQVYDITSSKRVFQSEWKDSGVPFYRAREIAVMSEGKVAPRDLFISVEMYNAYVKQYGAILENDILITGVGTLGKVYVVKDTDQFYFKDGNIIWLQWNGKCCSNYIKHLYDTSLLQRQVHENACGSTVGTYTITNAKDTLIPFPPLPEQRRIAEALSDVDELIASLEKLIAKKKAIKQGAMQELLTGKRRLQGFSGEWKTKCIRDLGRFVGGGTPSTKNEAWWDGSIPWISSSDLEVGEIRKIQIKRFITQEAVNCSATCICPANTVLIVSRVGVGKVGVAPCALCTSQDFSNLILYDVNPLFVAFSLSVIMREIAETVQGTSIKGVTTESVAAIELVIPEQTEQEAIVSVLLDMDNELEQCNHKLSKARQIKQGMMQQLLTGKIRI